MTQKEELRTKSGQSWMDDVPGVIPGVWFCGSKDLRTKKSHDFKCNVNRNRITTIITFKCGDE